ncbi:unnamed protein product, partial [Mesorhabditis belari]|uniref:Protein kinase domain-containing protein n=1 Tax=Mesorhabditis belari TaxID=2138241 RepID=A0AAF3FE05_9BILA
MMLTHKGDFLVRTTEPVAGQPRAFVLSVMWDPSRGEEQGIKHFVVKQHQGAKVSIEKFTFTMPDDYNQQQKGHRTIGRQPWELNHIECTKKRGEGAFGEVHKGKLELRGGKLVDVAVKLAKLEVRTKEQIKEIMREARLMQNFDNSNVVKFY